MEKYQGLAELTEKYLYGKLSKLILEYNTPTDLHVSIQYEDENDYWFDYDLEINKDNKYVDFLGHHSKSVINKVNLARNEKFEKAIFNHLFKTVTA